ncbi:hypothetical protein V8F33_008116 [Rhypophila sp. PSN 637]
MLVGFLFAAAMLLVTPTIYANVDKYALLACVVISWPLLNAIGYMASLFEGIGSGKPILEDNRTRGDEYQPLLNFEEKAEPIASHQSEEQQPQRPGLLPLQLIGVLLLSLTMYYWILSAVLFGLIDNRYKAAILAFALRTSVGRFIIPRRKDISLTTVNLPLVVRDEPVELFRIYSLAAIHLGGIALFWIDMSAAHSSNPNSSSILRRILFHADHPFKRLKWTLLVYLVDVLFKVAADSLSRPRPPLPRSSRQRGTSRKRATSSTTRRILQTINKPRFMASAAGLALVGLVILAVYSDDNPKVITSVEEAQARGVVRSHHSNSGNVAGIRGGHPDGVSVSRLHFVLQVLSSWQFVVSTFGVAALPCFTCTSINPWEKGAGVGVCLVSWRFFPMGRSVGWFCLLPFVFV